MSRGNRKTPIFEDDDDRRLFLAVLRRSMGRYEARCYAFCLMGNHYHLLIATPRGNLSDVMRHVNGVYTQTSNRRHERSGHLLEGRFRSIIVEAESYLREVARYVVLNPVRAGLVADPGMWAWSSYRATAGLEAIPSLLHVSWLAWVFGGRSWPETQAGYRQFVHAAIPTQIVLDEGALLLGTPAFENNLRAVALKKTGQGPLPSPWHRLARPALGEIFGASNGTRARRDALIHDAHVIHGYRLAEIAAFLKLRPSTMSIAMRRVEISGVRS